jgi:hypothetical protein
MAKLSFHQLKLRKFYLIFYQLNFSDEISLVASADGIQSEIKIRIY